MKKKILAEIDGRRRAYKKRYNQLNIIDHSLEIVKIEMTYHELTSLRKFITKLK